jgi:hypothetical protein
MDTAIGGYFELELRGGEHYHKGVLCLNSARSCFEYVLRARGYKKVYLPYYTCEIMVQPCQLLHIDYEFYHIDKQLDPIVLPELEENEAFLYTNYFGLKQQCVERLVRHYGSRLIVDNAQAFFAPAFAGIDTFYSPRKFLGVSDGGYLYCDAPMDMELPQSHSYARMSHLLKRMDLGAEAGYGDFKTNDENLSRQPIMKMSVLTEKILKSIDYISIKETRRRNYQILEEAIGKDNALKFDLSEEAVPMVYPFLPMQYSELKKKLIENKIFIATYWPNVMEWCKKNDWEYQLAQQACFLPVDQRYGEEEMKRILNMIV